MLKRIAFLSLASVALVAGGVAQATPGTHPTHPKKPHNVPFIFAGVVVSTTAADTTTGAKATVTITVKRSNRHGRAFRNQAVTLTITDTTRMWKRGKGAATVADLLTGDRVHVKSWAPRGSGPGFAFDARWIRDFTAVAPV